MLKINATTGQVIKKQKSDVYAPRDVQQVQHDQMNDEDRIFQHMKDEASTVEAMYTEQEDLSEHSTDNDENLEEELQVIDEKVDA